MLEDDAEATAFARQHGLLRPPTFAHSSDPRPITRIKLQYTTLAREVLGLLREERENTMKELQGLVNIYRQEQREVHIKMLDQGEQSIHLDK